MFTRLLKPYAADYIKDKDFVSELRLRAGMPMAYSGRDGKTVITDYRVDKSDIEYTLQTASGGSLYTVADMLKKGYLIYDGGIRIGIAGEGVTEDNALLMIKNIRYLTIRIPKEIKPDVTRLRLERLPKNTLIISPPGGGKTTLLRALTRFYSNNGVNVLLIDERYEIAAVKDGCPVLDVGMNTDVLSGVPKAAAYGIAVRTMRPALICTDELYEAGEAEALLEAACCGVKLIVTAHAGSKEEFMERKAVSGIMKVVERVITLSEHPAAGTITGVEVLK